MIISAAILSWLSCRNFMNARKSLKPLAFSIHPALRIVFRRDPRFGQRVEQGGFSDVRQAYDAALQTHDKPSKTGEEVYSILNG